MSSDTVVPEQLRRARIPGLHEPGAWLGKYVRRVRTLFGGDDAHSLLVAAVVGTLTGFGALGFRYLVNAVSHAAFGNKSVLKGAAELSWTFRLGLPVVGMLAAWLLTRWFAKEARGHGVPEVMDAVAHAGGRIRPRVVLVKAAASAMSIGTGGSVGREGPIVQIGSAIGSVLAQLLHRDHARTRLFLACGAAAGIAATFNAPIAGVVFSIEIILGAATIRTFSPIVVSAVMATTVSRWFLGEAAAFRVPVYALKSSGELVAYLILGLVAGLLGVLFVRLLYGLEDLFERLPGPSIIAPVLGGLLVGGIGLFVPQVYGLGYEAIEAELHGQMVLGALMGMLIAKMLATSLTLAGGGSGGVFAPSLFLGATLGGSMGILANQAHLWATASPGAYALVGMAAVVAATTHAPLTAVIIIFELTGSYEVILPLMLASIIASVVSVLLQRDSIYTMKLTRRGTNIHESVEAAELRGTPVKELLSTAVSVLSAGLRFDRVVECVLSQDVVQHYVVNKKGRLLGIILLSDVKGLLAEASLKHVVNAHDMMRSDIPTVAISDEIGTCLDCFAKAPNAAELPVVDEQGVLKGVIRHQDILRLYNRKLLRTDDLGVLFVTKEDESKEHDYVELPAGHGVKALDVPQEFVGKTLADLDLRAQHGLLVIGVRQKHNGARVCVTPDPHKPITSGTVLVVEGPKQALDWVSSL